MLFYLEQQEGKWSSIEAKKKVKTEESAIIQANADKGSTEKRREGREKRSQEWTALKLEKTDWKGIQKGVTNCIPIQVIACIQWGVGHGSRRVQIRVINAS